MNALQVCEPTTDASISTQLVPNTVNSYRLVQKGQRRILCSNSRPCYETWYCGYCYGIYRQFMRVQMETIAPVWKLTHFHTATIQKHEVTRLEDLKLAAHFKRQLSVYLRGAGKSISAISIGGGWSHPHLHMMASAEVSELVFRDAALKCRDDEGLLPLNIQTRPIEQGTEADLLDYLIHKNVRPSAHFRPPRLRLLTSSRGLRTGKPRSLTEVPNWKWNDRKVITQ